MAPGMAREQGELVARRPRDVRRVGADGVRHQRRARVGPVGAVEPEGQPAEGAGQPGQRGRQQRRAAPVDRDHLDRLAGHLRERLEDRLLERVVGVAGSSRCPSRWRRRWRASRRACPSSSSGSAPCRRRRGSPARAPRRRAGSRAGSAAPTRRARPTARIFRTPSTWKGSPECDAQVSASSSGGRSSPSRTIPSAWSGLLQDRGRIGSSTRPTDQSTPPSAPAPPRSRSGAPPRTRSGRSRRRRVRHGGRLATGRWQDDTRADLPRAPALPHAAGARRPRAAVHGCAGADLPPSTSPAARSRWACRRRSPRRARSSWSTPRGCRWRWSPPERRRVGGQAAHARAVRPVPPALPHPRPGARAYAGRTFVPVVEPLTEAQIDRLPRCGPPGAARAGRRRHALALPGRPDPGHARRRRPPGRRGGRGAARRARRPRGGPRARRPGGRELRRTRSGRGARPAPEATDAVETYPPRSARSSTSTGRRSTGRAWSCSSPASPAAASRRSPARSWTGSSRTASARSPASTATSYAGTCPRA